MERGFYKEDIEELLKEKADQYKMYPSDKVWKGIHRSLHPNRKWYWFSLILFLGAVGYYTFIEFITPSTSSKAISENNPANISKSTEATTESNNNEPAVIVPFGNPKQTTNRASSTTTRGTFILNPDNNEGNSGIVINMNEPTLEPAVTNNVNIPGNTLQAFNHETPVYDLDSRPVKKFWQSEHIESGAPITDANNQTYQVPAAVSLINPTAIDGSKLGENTQNAEEDSKRLGWLAGNAVYELPVPKQKRMGWQLTFAPTMNYRTWRGSNYPSDVKTLPLAPIIEGDPEKLVNHKPALGFEVGSNILYTFNKTFTLKTGLLFNYTRYDIQAYSSSNSEPATIALNSNVGIATGELTTYTRYRNFGGDAAENLHNQYFQLSVPVGLEINLLGNDKIHVGIGGSIQPTYLLNRNSYLLTADYKYATEPSLVRKWNVNTSTEAFLSYKTGDLKWQVGPQLRYQLFSSYIKKYPIRENLFNYGIKIGVTKTFH
ncbi:MULTISPECIES: outer membrane beta-barrel protein [Niastella]|uniref:Outer membrane beta-barrel protein n=1 Tax=Niastella soli TaxID=2821487 RepID=A0ABS3YQW2_9BACT|nr:outer membrane beta-barrel protein [Niastella soli]MBO9200265.1 outer membrane beta-barrel protein [Niastella soli]